MWFAQSFRVQPNFSVEVVLLIVLCCRWGCDIIVISLVVVVAVVVFVHVVVVFFVVYPRKIPLKFGKNCSINK